MTEQPQIARVRVYEDKIGEYRWKAEAGNGEEVADSGEGYTHKTDCYAAAQSLFPDADIIDET